MKNLYRLFVLLWLMGGAFMAVAAALKTLSDTYGTPMPSATLVLLALMAAATVAMYITAAVRFALGVLE